MEITSIEKKPKDPKRVEAGKRLGAISKAAKEKKARERYDRERDEEDQRQRSAGMSAGIVGVIVVGAYCLWTRQKTDGPHVITETVSPDPGIRGRRSLDSFD